MRRSIVLLSALLLSTAIFAQTRKVQNRPYIDQRKFHYGFLAGIHTQDIKFINNGLSTEDGQTWFADIPEYSPGFTVGVLGEFFLNEYLALRIIPSLYFGDKRVIFRENTTGETTVQNIKSSFISIPVNLKFAAERLNNYRPYIMAGINPVYDLSVRKRQPLLVKPFDCYIEVGLGCDFYLPFFKLIPELKFCFGLSNLVDKKRSDLNDLNMMKYTHSVDKATARMIALTFYFE